ncbi:MAG TPA: WD40 repeat domain-containing protein, partial [Acidimicrobiia bacterium]|nr:WD40 repeat domain-containing protein [Acidimicrobiia bacterium]
MSGRLLVTDREAETREPVIEIAHEALLTHWSRLRDWVEADRQWLRQLQHLALATHTWDDAGRPDAELYRGARLEAAIEALPDRRGELTPNEIAFVEAGQRVRDADREQERRVARRTRRLLGVVAGALVIALIAGAVAFLQRGNARAAADAATDAQREAEIEALIGRIETLRSTQRDAAALLAIEAFKLADTPRTRAALLSTFTENPGYLDTHQLPPGNDLYFGVVMDDGKHAFVTTRDHVIRPYDLETGELGKPWPVMANKPLPFSWLQGSPDGTSLAQNSDNESQTGVAASTIGVFDVANGALRFPALQLPIGIGIILFSPDGKLLAAAGGTDETVTVFDAFTGRELGRYRGLDQPGDIRWGTAGISFLGNRQLAIGSIQGRVRIVDVPSMRVAREFPVPDATTQELSTLDGGRALLGIGLNGLIRFDATTGARTWFVPESRDSCSMYTVIESRNRVYCSDVFGRLDERDLGDGHVVRQLDAQKGAAGSLWPARNDTELVEFGNGATVVTRWRLDGTGPITRRLEPGAVASRYSPDGSQLIGLKVVGDARQFEPKLADAALLDARTGKVVDELEGIVSPGWITPDRLGGAVMDGDDFVLTQYDPVSKRRSPGIRLPGEGLSGGLNVGTGKTWMFYDRDKGKTEIQTIDVKTSRRVEPTFTVPSFAKADASADGSRFVVAAEDIIVYDTTTGKEVGRIKGHFLNGVHLTRNNVVFAWSLGGALKVYDLKTLKPIRELAGNRGYLVDVKSDARGGTIAASGGDRQVTLYDAATGVALGESITVADEESTLIALRP